MSGHVYSTTIGYIPGAEAHPAVTQATVVDDHGIENGGFSHNAVSEEESGRSETYASAAGTAKLHACINCKKSKVSCSTQRPCPRCVRLNVRESHSHLPSPPRPGRPLSVCDVPLTRARPLLRFQIPCGDIKEIKLACLNCRRSKVKCGVTPGTPCARCVRLGVECVIGGPSVPRSAPPSKRATANMCPLSLLSAAATQPHKVARKKPRVEPPTTQAQPRLSLPEHLASAPSLTMLAMSIERAEAQQASQPAATPPTMQKKSPHLVPATPQLVPVLPSPLLPSVPLAEAVAMQVVQDRFYMVAKPQVAAVQPLPPPVQVAQPAEQIAPAEALLSVGCKRPIEEVSSRGSSAERPIVFSPSDTNLSARSIE